MKLRSARDLTLLLIAAAIAAPAQAQGWGGSAGVGTDYVFRGVSESAWPGSLQADVHYYDRSGWLGGIWGTTFKERYAGSTGTELDSYLGYSRPVGEDWSTRLALVRYAYPLDRRRQHYDYNELVATAVYGTGLAATVAYSPDTSVNSRRGAGSGHAASGDLALNVPLVRALSANAGAGYYDLHDLFGTGYAYWNAGLSYRTGAAQLDLSYIGTSAAARSLFFPGAAGDRAVAVLLWHF